MNKKGFTLIELLAVIVILAIILIIAIPKIMDIIEESRLSTYYLNSDNLKDATEKYIYSNNIDVPLNTTITVSYSDVKNANYIKSILDPKSKTECTHSNITITNTDGKYIYDANLVCDNYMDLNAFNKIANSDFSNGTTDWNGVDSVISASDKILLNTGNGAYNLPTTTQVSTLNAITGHKIYVFVRSRVTNSNNTQMTITLSSTSWNWDEVAYNYNSETNTWYNISALDTIDSGYSGNIKFMLSHGYADAATANNKTLEIDGNYGVYLFDLTAIYGAGNEPTKTAMDNIIENMK